MPIYDDNYGSRIAHFGYGDIMITKASTIDGEAQTEIALMNDTQQNQPNTMIDPERWAEYAGKKSDEVPVPIRLKFDRVGSIDAVMEELGLLREGMVAAKANMAEVREAEALQ